MFAKKLISGGVFDNEHAQSHARYGIVCNRTKKRQTFDHPQMIDVPSFIGAFCEPNKLKIDWMNCFCVLSNSYLLQHQTHKITHTNQFDFQAHVKTSWAGPGQPFDVADPVPHRGRGGASLRSATVFHNRFPSALKTSQTAGGNNCIPKYAFIPTQKNDPKSAD